MQSGTVLYLFIGPVTAQPMQSVPEVRAHPGKGLEGDRYCLGGAVQPRKRGPEREATLIEVEALEAVKREADIDFDASESRRNIVTRGIALNHLVGREFRVGEVTLRGIRLCEPCEHLVKLTGKGVREALIHRGGLRAQIVSAGTIRVGDPIAPA
jgi:MOSC domain-containing protein YiiM